MPCLQPLRQAKNLARLVLLWFALAMGAAIASPLVKPQALELVCSGSGAMKLLIQSDDGTVQVGSHTLDCALCVMLGAPPPVLHNLPVAPAALAFAAPLFSATRVASNAARPPPARGPPIL